MVRRDGGAPLLPGVNCYRVETATRASVIIDADDYFRVARAAMLKAKKRIVLIGWDFDARIRLGAPTNDGAPEKVGDFIYWLVQQNPELEVFLLRWDLGALKMLARGSTIFTVFKWMSHRRIHTKLDGAHPPAASHHQKIVVIDEALAFCGGIDMTEDRWDTRDHIHEDPRRVRPNGKPHKPWHDATTALEGPIARTLADIARDRWITAGGRPMPELGKQQSPWPDALDAQFVDVPIAVSRSAPEIDGRPSVLEIEHLYLDQIARAKRYIYAESQYFASRRVAEAMAKRLQEADGPEIVVINPDSAQGWLEPLAMDTARARLYQALNRLDTHGRFRIYTPVTSGGEPIYVHAKILIIDDEVVRIGSSNLNNRSMRLDTECDVTIDATFAQNEAVSETVRAIRNSLLGEHLAVSPDILEREVNARGLIGAIEGLRNNGKSLVPYAPEDLSAVEAWLADHEVLDPEGPEEIFEAFTKRGLFRRLRKPKINLGRP
ncbi:phospholipase D-like domain-containing protein [Devosia sp. Leaf64]|uniref:phospholipase D-like domain-containing protein n=1 Tax=Devosia sp. Leaf64 TaxID=1736229 RepID=UPI00071265D3|nr:phospholipase D-like domain-containing protein [Devosia sp. Leaf64]KQN71577.1 phospholipase [Devosia sp. Leaf64]